MNIIISNLNRRPRKTIMKLVKTNEFPHLFNISSRVAKIKSTMNFMSTPITSRHTRSFKVEWVHLPIFSALLVSDSG